MRTLPRLIIFLLLSSSIDAFAATDVPDWVTKTPEHCFVGISNPCNTIEEARQQAIDSAVSQILQTMGAEYSLNHISTLSGTHSSSNHELKEQLAYNARWSLRSIQQHIEQSAINKNKDKYVYFILVRFPPKRINRLRRLTIGPKIAARIVDEENDCLVIEAKETNGAQATFTDYHIAVATKNHHAGLITLFAWKVPESSNRSFDGVINQKVTINESTQTFTIPNPSSELTLKQFVLGVQKHIKIFLHGHDEISRPISVPVSGL